MRIPLLDLKLLRDLRALRSQVLAVALVMGCGLTMMIMTRSLIRSLETARDRYYETFHFAQIFAQLKRAPAAVEEEIAKIEGVAVVQTNVAIEVTLDIPGLAEPARAQINSVPDVDLPRLNRLYVRSGHLLSLDTHQEVLISEPFAEANHLHPGDTIFAILNGKKTALSVAGVVLSPEFIFEAPPGAALPDNRTYGIFWMRYEEVAEAYSLFGAFNKVALTLAPHGNEKDIIARLDRILAPYGGLGAFGRADHPSHIRVSDELRVLQVLSFGFPLVFLSVAAFMTHAVVSRQINLQREQIAILKAFGFSDLQVGWHFLKFALVVVVGGTALGLLGGIALGHRLVLMYHLFFRFPHLDFLLSWVTVFAASLVGALAAIVGVSSAVIRAVRLPPAEAMRPEAPAQFRTAWIERTGVASRVALSVRMAVRNLERKPWQAFLTAAALGLATGILVIPNAFRDGIQHVLDFQWDLIQRETVTVRLIEPGAARAIHDFAHLPGVIRAEPLRAVPAQLRAGSHTRRLAVVGIPRGGELTNILDQREQLQTMPTSGLMLSHKLATVLGVQRGDLVEVQVLSETRPHQFVPVTGIAEDFAGIVAYMDYDTLNRFMEDGDRVDGARLTVQQSAWKDFLTAVKNTPRTSGAWIKDAMRASFRETTAKSIGLIQTIYLVFATVVAFGIAYNSARIALSERQRELATLRVLGFSQSEVGAVLVMELVILAGLSLPFGLLLGSGLAKLILGSINTETVRVPLVLSTGNYAYAITVMTVATGISLAFACRRLNQLDLVGALKAPE